MPDPFGSTSRSEHDRGASATTRRRALALIAASAATPAFADKIPAAADASLAMSIGKQRNAGDPSISMAMIEPGTYEAQAFRRVGGSIRLVARIPGSVTILIPAREYFLTIDGLTGSVLIDGIEFVGGLGVLHLTNTADNVAGLFSVSRCVFRDYTECAIGNNARDHPYLRVTDCLFLGAPRLSTFGIAWGGYVDGSQIIGNSFLRNAYHLKIGPRISGSVHIERNDFLSFGETPCAADIWLVPNSDLGNYGNNAGTGFALRDNKFGNENQTLGSPRILIAEEDENSGVDRQTRRPSSEPVSTQAALTGLSITGHRISGVSDNPAPVILSRVSDVRNLYWRDNKFDGGPYSYLVEFDKNRILTAYNTSWDVAFGPADGIMPRLGISNSPIGPFEDRAALNATSAMALPSAYTGDDPHASILIDVKQLSSFKPFGGASIRPATDTFGRIDGSVLVSEATRHGGTMVALPSVAADSFAWLQMEIMPSRHTGAANILIEVRDPVSGASAVVRTYPMPEKPTHIVVPFVLPSGSGWHLIASAGDEGLRVSFGIARLVINLGRQPIASGHLRTVGDGAWDGPHLVMGDHHIWIAADGTLRIGQGAPTRDMDGRKVGA